MSQSPSGPRHGASHLTITRDPAPPMAEYDALADLFLGDGGPALAPAPAQPQAAPAMRTLKLTSDQPAAAPRQAHAATTDRAGSTTTRKKVPMPTGFEALALGHLPVMASAWAMQYARSVAVARQEPVAVLRIGSGKVSLEVVGDQADTGAGLIESLDLAVRAAAQMTDAWMLRVDEPTETELSGIPGVNGITLLTGADEVAIVNSYRAIKGYLENGLISRVGDEDGPNVTLRLAVMGAPEERAKEAAERIRRAASTYLGCAVESVICSPKISPAATRTLFRSDAGASVKEIVASVVESWKSGPATSTPAETPIESAEIDSSIALHVDTIDETAIETAPEVPAIKQAAVVEMPSVIDDLIDVAESTPAPVEPPAAPARVEVAAVRRTESRAETTIETSGSHSRIGPRPGSESYASLCQFLAGLSPINVRCPFAPHAELACACDGTLHIIGQNSQAGDAQRVIESLVAASSWAEVHGEILRQIRPGLRAGHARAVLHLLTERAKDVRPLIDSEIKLHAIVRGPAGMVTVADLN